MSELPEDAINAATQALCDKYAQDEQLVGKAWREVSRADAVTALAAALPFLERETRDKIADEINAQAAVHPGASDGEFTFGKGVYNGFRRAARLARGLPVARGGEATE